VVQPIYAQSADSIVITENSSTSLTVTFDGSTSGVNIFQSTPDQWRVIVPIPVLFGFFEGTPAWVEPENSALANVIDFFPKTNELIVFSDLNSSGFAVLADETTRVGVRSLSVSVTFDDDAADARTVPETGSTLTLLFLSLIVLLGATGFRRFRRA
jgi:hypothetical protein